MKEVINEEYLYMNQSPSQFLERRLATMFGINSMSIRALDLVKKEMCVERGFCRDDGQHYYNHCIDVANTLIFFGIKDEDVICAAILHDMIEDVEGFSFEAIDLLFNHRVAHFVRLVTKQKGVDYTKAENVQNYIEGISSDIYASAIKTADRMHNMMTLQEKTFDARYRKALETEKYYLPFFKRCRQIYPRYENLFYAARTQIAPLIFEIKSLYEEMTRISDQNKIYVDEIERLKKEIEALKKTDYI